MNRLTDLVSKISQVADSDDWRQAEMALRKAGFNNSGPKHVSTSVGDWIFRSVQAAGFAGDSGFMLMTGPPPSLFFIFPGDDQPGEMEIKAAFGNPHEIKQAPKGEGYHATYLLDVLNIGFNVFYATKRSSVLRIDIVQK